LDKESILRLAEETAYEIIGKNEIALSKPEVLRHDIELAVRLSAVTTLRILQKLEILPED